MSLGRGFGFFSVAKFRDTSFCNITIALRMRRKRDQCSGGSEKGPLEVGAAPHQTSACGCKGLMDLS